MGPAKWLEKKKEELGEAFNFEDLKKRFTEATVTSLALSAVKPVLAWTIKSFSGPAGWVAGALKAIYDAVRWFLDNAKRIRSLVDRVITGFRQLVGGAGIKTIAANVEQGIADTISPLMDAPGPGG